MVRGVGEGSFGMVALGTRKKDNEPVIIKRFPLDDAPAGKEKDITVPRDFTTWKRYTRSVKRMKEADGVVHRGNVGHALVVQTVEDARKECDYAQDIHATGDDRSKYFMNCVNTNIVNENGRSPGDDDELFLELDVAGDMPYNSNTVQGMPIHTVIKTIQQIC